VLCFALRHAHDIGCGRFTRIVMLINIGGNGGKWEAELRQQVVPSR
jgi:hypothetical protein